MDNTNWVVIGRFGRPHGIKGMITVISFTEPRENIVTYEPWYAVDAQKNWQPLPLMHVEVSNKVILAQIEGYQEREQVARLTNVEIAIKHEQLPKLGAAEFYWHQLLGMQVVNQEGAELGKVTDIMPTGANDVLVVEGKHRHLIPYLPKRFVLKVDDKARLITVDWDSDFS